MLTYGGLLLMHDEVLHDLKPSIDTVVVVLVVVLAVVTVEWLLLVTVIHSKEG